MMENTRKKPYPKEELEKKLGYVFRDKPLLTKALTHSSYSNELKAHGNKAFECNERLEFLGDSVLSLAVSRFLYSEYSDRPEGDLTKMRASVVCERALAKFANSLGLGDYLLLGHGEERTGGRERKSLIADAFEATLAAIYLDAGKDGFDIVSSIVIPMVREDLESREDDTFDYKTLLQQIVQSAEGEVLEYVLVSETGPAHDRRFEVQTLLNSNVIGRGFGATKREAEQMAAKEAVALFGEKA
jgi:ribonuclease-3